MTDLPDVETVAAQNLALTHLLTRLVFPAFAAIDPEGWKQMLDDEAEHCERVLSRPANDQHPAEAIFRDAARHELDLLRSAFDGA